MNRLRLLRLNVCLRFNTVTCLPSFIGNTVRGAFGNALHEIGGDAYAQVFKNEHAESVPNPFVIDAPYPSQGEYAAGDQLSFELILLGDACVYKNEATAALKNICRGKIEGAEVTQITQVYDREWSDEGADSIPFCDTLTLRFITPTEILSNKNALKEIDFEVFTKSLFGRIGGIVDNYGGEFVLPYKLLAAKPPVITRCELTQAVFQTSGQPISGFTGTVKFYGDVTRYLPYIDLGSQLHIGKKTTRSCGQYNFEI